jgi:hypothetical protein
MSDTYVPSAGAFILQTDDSEVLFRSEGFVTQHEEFLIAVFAGEAPSIKAGKRRSEAISHRLRTVRTRDHAIRMNCGFYGLLLIRPPNIR